MAFGELNLNYDASTGGLFYKDTAGAVVKVGPCQVSATAPNSSPAGSAGNSAGEFWFDSSTSTLKIYNGTAWVEAGGSVQGVTGTAPITVDNSDPLNPVVGVSAASTSAPGVVQLNNTTSSTSTTEALTANQGRNLQQQIDALVVSSNLTFAGTLDASTGNLVTVTTEGTAQGFAIGSPLPSPAAGNSEFFVIATVGAASYTPPGGSATEVHVGDWFLSDGTVWNFLDVGFQSAYASTTSAGIVQLATDAEVQAGVNTDHAVVPSSLQSKLSDSVSTTSSTTIASSTAVKTAFDAAGVAQTDADAAQATANQAILDAAAAQGTADQAVLDAAAAQSTANQAVLDAAAAQSAANSAQIDATQALADAASAQGDATQALADAAAAQATADQAVLDAAAAQDTADQAVLDAAAAQGDATQALADAAAAQVTADQAVLDAAAAQATADAAMPKAGGTFSGVVTFDQTPVFPTGVDIGAAGQVTYDNATSGLAATNVQAAIDELAGEVDGVQGITGTAPITVDNTDPANPVVGVNAASTSAAGAVQLNDTVTSTSVTESATANSVKVAYDAAVAAAASGDVSGIASNTVIFVNSTDGNNSTGQRGTTKAFLTITAALAVALNGDTIFLSPGTFIENVNLTKGVNLVGTYNEQGMAEGTSIQGNFVFDMVNPAATSNPTLNHIRFVSPNTTNAFKVLNNSFGAGGVAIINDCAFVQAGDSSITEFAFETTGTWTRSMSVRRATFDGNVKHAAGTASGATGGYLVLDDILATGSATRHYNISTGTVEFRRPSNSISPVLQTGGVVLFTDCISGISPSNATTSPIFGGTNICYKGSAASVGTGTVYFNGYAPISGAVQIGANLVYGWSALNITPANLTISGSAVAYTTAVPAAAAVVTASQQRPRFDLLTATSSVAAASQLGTVIDSTTGALYSVSSFDCGTY